MAIARRAPPKTTAKSESVKPGAGSPRVVTQWKTLMPFGVGLLFPLVATFLAIGVLSLPVSLGSVLTVHTQPLLWLIDLVPFAMWLVVAKSRPLPPKSVTTVAVNPQEQYQAGGPLVLEQVPQQRRAITTLQTELTTVKRELEQAQARELAAREALNDIKDALFILTVEGIVTDVNQSAEQALGWDRQELLGHPIQDLLTLASVPWMEAHLADMVANPSAVSFCEVEFLQSNGRGFWMEGCSSVLRNKAGEATGLLVTYRDLSHRRPQAERSSSPSVIAVPGEELAAEPQPEESSALPLSPHVTDSGIRTMPGLLPEHAHVTAEAGDDHPGERSFPETPSAADPELAETFAILSSTPATEPVSSSAPPRLAFTDEPETPLVLVQEATRAEETGTVSAAPIAAPDEEILDLTQALAHVGGDMELLVELAGLFLQEYPQVLENLRAAVGSGNVEGIMYNAHALRGSMSNFVTRETEAAARRLEQVSREGDITNSEQALNELETALERFLPALNALAARTDF